MLFTHSYCNYCRQMNFLLRKNEQLCVVGMNGDWLWLHDWRKVLPRCPLMGGSSTSGLIIRSGMCLLWCNRHELLFFLAFDEVVRCALRLILVLCSAVKIGSLNPIHLETKMSGSGCEYTYVCGYFVLPAAVLFSNAVLIQ